MAFLPPVFSRNARRGNATIVSSSTVVTCREPAAAKQL